MRINNYIPYIYTKIFATSKNNAISYLLVVRKELLIGSYFAQ